MKVLKGWRQSTNRFSSTSLMYPRVWPGVPCELSQCLRMETDFGHTLSSLWQTQLSYQWHVQNVSGYTTYGQNIIIYWAFSHLESLGSWASFDFSSALNTIQPLLLRQKLREIQPDNAKVSWIIDYLADRPQFVPSWSSILDLSLQWGTVLSPSLSTLYLWLQTQLWVTPPPDFL